MRFVSVVIALLMCVILGGCYSDQKQKCCRSEDCKCTKATCKCSPEKKCSEKCNCKKKEQSL